MHNLQHDPAAEHLPVVSFCRSLQRRAAQPFRTARASPAAPRSRKQMQCRAGNLLVEILGSGVGAAAVTAVTTFTSENRDAEIERLQVRTCADTAMLCCVLLGHKSRDCANGCAAYPVPLRHI